MNEYKLKQSHSSKIEQITKKFEEHIKERERSK